ncbi:MAG: hypothetical protein HOP10_07350 [Chitinophagaceae bacterium]|nr:hypothetical protein [Chitinophagaceae bacterium]
MRNLFLILFTLLIVSGCKKEKKISVEVKELPNYPSASGIEYLNGQVYIVGDDANRLLVLDSNLIAIDSITLYAFIEKRIPKNVKADLEGISFTPDKKLLIAGSGSLAPYRNIAWMVDPVTKQKDILLLDTFYQRLKQNGINEVNIEGIASMSGWIVLSNRGNKGYPKNHLIFTEMNFWKRQPDVEISVALAGFNSDTSSFNGVSGMTYSAKTDALIMTVSTEDTRNSLDDGAIGKSYLWIIKNISSKRRWKAINPDKIIDLDETDARFKGHKIESVCIMKEKDRSYHLLLAADNDNGSSTLFKLVVPMK